MRAGGRVAPRVVVLELEAQAVRERVEPVVRERREGAPREADGVYVRSYVLPAEAVGAQALGQDGHVEGRVVRDEYALGEHLLQLPPP